MRILVANNHLFTVGGSESFTWAMATELARQGHDVEVFDANGMPHYSCGTGASASIEYDAAFISHYTTARWMFAAHPYLDPRQVIQTIHGMHPLESPYTSRPIRHVVVSEELRAVYPEYPVIMNGVDLERFKPDKEKNGVFSLCQSMEMNNMLGHVCQSMGLDFSYRDKHTNPIADVSPYTNAAQIVVGLGRSAIEGMASGCAVIVADARAYQGAWMDGVITPQAYAGQARTNFSGRTYKAGVNVAALTEEIEVCLMRPKLGTEMRTYAKQKHDIRDVAARYLDIIEGKE